MNAPLVYVAGAYGDASGYLGIDRNIAIAREGCKWLAENGFFFLSPHMNSAHFEVITPQITIEHWYEQDIRLLRACDAMLLVGEWRKSRGVAREIEFARDHGIPIFAFNDDSTVPYINPRAALLGLKAVRARPDVQSVRQGCMASVVNVQ